MRLETVLLFHSKDTQSANTKTKRYGLRIIIEHPKGTKRVLHDDSGKKVYEKHMYHSYGYIEKTAGRDGDEVDVFLGPSLLAKEVYVVHMKDLGPVKKEREDEDKVFLGFTSAEAARTAFLLHYPKTFFDGMTVLSVQQFKKRLSETRNQKITASRFATLALSHTEGR